MVKGGTAIGSAIATSVNRLKDSNAKSKVIILLTDGRNNTGRIDPITAADVAEALNVKIYTIGAGKKGLVPVPVRDVLGNRVYEERQMDIDDESLMEIAEKTGGKYFRATDTQSLRNIYREIDQMEKVEVEMTEYLEFKELYPYLLMLAIIGFAVEIVLANTRFRRIP
jgi:Ca-activated chloride channel family protein